MKTHRTVSSRFVPGLLTLALAPLLLASTPAADSIRTEIKSAAINGTIDDGKARLVIEADLKGLREDKDRLLFATALNHEVRISREKISHSLLLRIDILQGDPKEIPLAIAGEGEIRQVSGEALQDWSLRQETNNARWLVLRLKKTDKPAGQLTVSVTAERELKAWANPLPLFTLTPPQPALFNGYLKVDAVSDLDVQTVNPTGVVPLEVRFLPEELRGQTKPEVPEALAFRFLGSAYSLPLQLTLADPESRRVVLADFRLSGQLSNDLAAFTLNATARVRNPKGGTIQLLSGGVAFTETASHPDWRARYDQGRYALVFDKPGEYPLQFKFNAAVKLSNGWNTVDYRIAPASVQPLVLQGLAPDTQFQFAGAARPERQGGDFTTFLPPSGAVTLAWKEAKREAEGKLFFAAEALAQVNLSPGLMRQVALVNFKVMQGELNRVALLLRGAGEVTRVGGEQVLSWNLEPVPNSADRRLVVKLNQPQKEGFSLQVQLQTPLGAFPQAVDAVQVRPEGATRYAGFVRVINEGAVRLEVAQSSGLSQISPEQFPETDATKALFRLTGAQRFAFRFSSADFSLRVQADNVLPEIAVSQVLAYHLAETELAVDMEAQLDIREAPVRELTLRVPKGFALARLSAQGLTDYFLREPADQADAELRLVYAQPISGTQLVQLRLERNKPLAEAAWVLPRIEVVKTRSTRGHVGVSADAGFRLTPEKTQALTEIATAFFPKKLPNIQAAFRLAEPAWAATMRVERLPQTVQADAFHLFSIAEGIAYGSSVLNYLVSGAPVAAFKIELSNEYFNVEFIGKDVRNWTRTTNGYLVQLHTPVSGPYTLLATYERPFRSHGETLAFAGARPLDAQSEQGHTIVVSAYQFQVTPAEVSSGLLPLQPAEVPSEYRLFFDAPILAAYRYTSRPYSLRLALSRLAQGETLSQVVDRASLVTRISKEGQVITNVRYFVKNRGQPNFRLQLPPDTKLWSATVNGVAVVPVTDAQANLIPLPQRADPNAVLAIDLKLASQSKNPEKVKAVAPVVAAPILLGEWRIEPDARQRVLYRKGSLTPVGGVADASGFATLSRTIAGTDWHEGAGLLVLIVVSLGVACFAWRWGTSQGVFRMSAKHLVGTILGSIAFLAATGGFIGLGGMAMDHRAPPPGELTFLAPVQQAGSALSIEVGNVPAEPSWLALALRAWPVLLAVALWAYSKVSVRPWLQSQGGILAWTLVAWGVLRCPNSAPLFLGVMWVLALVYLAWPALRHIVSAPRKPASAAPIAPLVAALTLLGVSAEMKAWAAPFAKEPPIAGTVVQQVRVEEKFVFATARISWEAKKGQTLPILFEPAVITKLSPTTNALKLVQTSVDSRRCFALLAQADGPFAVDVSYQLQVTQKDGEGGFVLPTCFGLVNRVGLSLDLDVDVYSSQAVSVQRETVLTNRTSASLVLTPANDAFIGWKPRSRDVKREKPVFYAEIAQLYAPSAGVIEGLHLAQIRPAQGELSELAFDVPAGATIADVAEPAKTAAAETAKTSPGPAAPVSLISVWRFDPDTRKLRVTLSPAQSKPFALVIRSQIPTGPLPFEQSVGLLAVNGAAGQIGLLGIATGSEVQLDGASNDLFTPINLEDFPGNITQPLRAQIAGLMVRRAYRYSEPKGTATLKASAVEPDVRVETQETLSLGEDRTLLAANLAADITRAGIFRVSFPLPVAMEVESISGGALSHWTESKTDTNRVITLHLRGKTEGRQQFSLSLAGPGAKAATNWAVPRLIVREASKQQGQLLIVPEQGMRLQAGARDGVTQLDPQKANIRQKGVLMFRLLHNQWKLALDLEQVDPWVQVSSLQHVTVNEAQVKIAANLQYQIENTGLKSLRVLLPTNAESARFTGEQVADFLAVAGRAAEGMQEWEIKLHRRVIGKYLLQVSFQQRVPEKAPETVLRGVQTLGVNLQRGFVTVQSAGRLQVLVPTVPPALQPSEWQTVPRSLRQDMQTVSANFTFRLVEPGFTLPIRLERHEAAQLLPARVNNIVLTSVISDEGVMLTQVRMELVPGDKRLLNLTLPTNAAFWFAFVNQNGVSPWREQDKVLIPLEQNARSGQAVALEFFYSSRIGQPDASAMDLALRGPRFDLPLENINWQIYLNEKWRLTDWKGTLQLQDQRRASSPGMVNLEDYLRQEASLRKEKTREAEQMLALGNNALEQGDPQQARRAFQAAYGLSAHDDAFNEDARVQLHNLKLQQALLGLNFRQTTAAGDASPAASKLRDMRSRKGVAYTQQEAKQIMDSNAAEDNTALLKLAERLIQQQDAAVVNPAAIRASIPQQGRLLTFSRAVQVDPWSDMALQLQARAVRAASGTARLLILAGTLILLGLLALAANSFRRHNQTPTS